jgi:hypothetical protein
MNGTFGVNSTHLDDAARILGEILDLEFVLHESDWYGGDYYRAGTEKRTARIIRNFIDDDGDAFELDWPNNQIVLYLEGWDDQSLNQAVTALQITQLIGIAQLACSTLGKIEHDS